MNLIPAKHAKNIFQQILTLSTAAFGLAAALAWNEVILTVVRRYLSFDIGSEIISRLIYAIIVTALAVTVTIYLTRLKERFEEKNKPRD
ncbi:hypothetical protein A2797_02580 [candidate division WWE3 bacterium RIFCSPHIGHO2_01_FULL_48_15]|uniref:Uncharacterized protein n=1 Tax=candidate division WWE3 bacterium RIFCSPHIGHO2_01_FULL_48_15 TaxID=1802619 RepID=A0A1F4VB07_UNCKA|nr:MAG: hypothetical protein A2797_02580 [candidate division WWE3 bacterium RIFCSPHIGHO2_01_FULL_48_15]